MRTPSHITADAASSPCSRQRRDPNLLNLRRTDAMITWCEARSLPATRPVRNGNRDVRRLVPQQNIIIRRTRPRATLAAESSPSSIAGPGRPH